MQQYGVPAKMTRIVKMLHSDKRCCVCHECRQSDWFNVDTGVKQDCVMAGFLFLLVTDYVMCPPTTGARRGQYDGNLSLAWKIWI